MWSYILKIRFSFLTVHLHISLVEERYTNCSVTTLQGHDHSPRGMLSSPGSPTSLFTLLISSTIVYILFLLQLPSPSLRPTLS